MCRNIKPLFNFDPPHTVDEIRAASLQYVRKISGFNKPSKVNEPAFLAAVDEVARISNELLSSLRTDAIPKDRMELPRKLRPVPDQDLAVRLCAGPSGHWREAAL
jgi:hypothetical protein